MNEIITKEKIKCVPIVITPEIKEEVRLFKENLEYLRDNPECSSDFDVRTINIILNELDDYDRNILIAFYTLADTRVCNLSRLFNISTSVLSNRINNIMNKIKELNDTPKSPHNKPRGNPDN